MNGKLSDQPLAELIREISVKHLSGRLRVQRDRVAVVIYFKAGNLLYAATNVRQCRLREYLIKDNLLSEGALSSFDTEHSDIALAKKLVEGKILTPEIASGTQQRQVMDILRLALLWTEGNWEFSARAHLSETVDFKIDSEALLLDVGRRLPAAFAASRLSNLHEVISPIEQPSDRTDLQTSEVFLLSRLDVPTSIHDLIITSGQQEMDALKLIYALSLTGLVKRQSWKSAFRNEPENVSTTEVQPTPPVQTSPAIEVKEPAATSNNEDLESFLLRLGPALSYYDVLQVASTATPEEIKKSYYDLARKYHPDRFRKDSDADQQARIDSAFAKITQAYDTLRDPRSRSTYDSKLQAQARAKTLRDSAPAAFGANAPPPPLEHVATAEEKPQESSIPLSDVERAETSFKDGFAAKQLGQINTAIGMFSTAARLVPTDARYRAYYGQALAAHPGSRRLAEVELLAAVKLDPKNAEYRLMIAELYRDLGFAVRARSELEKVLSTTPNNQKARELLRTLK